MERGGWTNHIIDGALYIGPDQLQDPRRDVLSLIERGRPVPEVFCYRSDSGFYNWMRLTQDPGYRYYQESVHFFRRSAQSIVRSMTDTVKDPNIDFLSLGPGNGHKDLLLLRSLEEITHQSGSILYYYPFDINANMIVQAMVAVGGDRKLAPRLRVKGIVGNIDSLPMFSGVYQYRSSPNVIALLGNTLGNLQNDRGFLEQVFESTMYDGDQLILEVRRCREADAASELGDVDLNNRFSFGPLELLGVPYEGEKLKYSRVQGISGIPEAISTLSLYEGLIYGGKNYGNVKLSYIHEYQPERLEQVLRQIGFEIVSSFHEALFLLYILRKPRA